MAEKIKLPDDRILTIDDTITPENRAILRQQIKSMYDGFDIDKSSIFEQAINIPKDIVGGALQTTLDVPLGVAGLFDVGNDSKFIQDLQSKKKYLAEESIFANDTQGPISTVARGLGSTVPFLLGGVGSAAAKGAGLISRGTATAIPFGIAAPTGIARQVESQQRAKEEFGETVNPFQEILSEVLGAGVGATEVIPISNILRRTTKGTLKNFDTKERLKSIGIGGLAEGVQEATASTLQDLVARGVYSDKLPIAESIVEEFAVGATVGGILDAVLNTKLAKRGVENIKYREQEEQLRENKNNLINSKKFEKASEQGEIEVITPKVASVVPEVKIPEGEILSPSLTTIENANGTFSVIDSTNLDKPVVETFNTETKAIEFKNKENNRRFTKNLEFKLNNVLYDLGLINSKAAFEAGQTMFDPNAVRLKATSLFNYDSRVPDNATPAKKKQMFAKSGLKINATYTFEEARKYLKPKDFDAMLDNVANAVLAQSQKDNKSSIQNDKSEINTTPKYIKQIAESKNIELDFNDPAVEEFSLAVTGFKNITKTRNKGAKKLFLARINSLEPFNKKTTFPDFRARNYSAEDLATFVANMKAKEQTLTKKEIEQHFNDPKLFSDLIKSGRIVRTIGSKYKVVDNFEFEMARRAEGFNETPEEFGQRLQSEGKLPQETIDQLVQDETIKQQRFLPPVEAVPKMLNFAQAIEEGRKNKFAQEVRKMLDGVGLKETGIVISDDILSTETLVEKPDGTIVQDPKLARDVASEYDANTDTIFVALSNINPDGNLTEQEIEQKIMERIDGNIINALRAKDLFTEKEYQFLRGYVQRAKVPDTYDPKSKNKTFYARSQSVNTDKAERMRLLEGTSPDAIDEMYIEEAIADVFRARNFTPNPVPKVEGIFGKIKNFFASIGQAMRRSSINNANELFTRIEDGGVGIRERGQIRTLREVDRISILDELRKTNPEIDEELKQQEEETTVDDVNQPDTSTEEGTPVIATTSANNTFAFMTDLVPEGMGNVSVPRPVNPVQVATPTPTTPTTTTDTQTTETVKPYDEYTRTAKEAKEEDAFLKKSLKGMDMVQVMNFLVNNAPSKDYKIIAEKVLKKLNFIRNKTRSERGKDFNFEFFIYEKDGDITAPTADRRVEILKYIRKNKQTIYGVSFGQTGQKQRNADGKLVNINPVVVIMGDSKKHQVSFDTLLHEGIHAATQAELRRAKRFGGKDNLHSRLENLRKAIKRRRNKIEFQGKGMDKVYDEQTDSVLFNATKNTDELLAWGLTNRKVQKFMEDTDYNPKTGDSLWTKFVREIRRTLGLQPQQNNALSRLLRLSDQAFMIDKPADKTEARAPPQKIQTKTDSYESVSRRLIDVIKENPEGFTVDILNPDVELKGISVAPLSQKIGEIRLEKNRVSENTIDEFIKNITALAKVTGDRVFAGGWYNTEDGVYVLDAVQLIDNREDALYTALAGDQDAIFDLNTFDEINTIAGIRELKDNGTYNIDKELQKRLQLETIEREFIQAKASNPENLFKEFSAFARAKRYADAPTTSAKKQLIQATEKAETLAKLTPNGQIPTYNTNASDVALKSALDFNSTPDKKAEPPDIPFKDGAIPEELQNEANAVYRSADDSAGKRLIDAITGDRKLEAIRDFWGYVRRMYVDKYDPIVKFYRNEIEKNELVRQRNLYADTSTESAIRLSDKSKGVFQQMLNIGVPVSQIEGEASITKVIPFKIKTKFNDFIDGSEGFGGLTQITAPLFADPSINKEAIFGVYGALKRKTQIDSTGKVIPVPFSTEKIEEKLEFIETNYPEVVEVYENYQAWNNQLIGFAKDKGLLSDKSNRSELIGRFNDLIDSQTSKKERNKLKKALKDAREIDDLDKFREEVSKFGIDVRGTAIIWQENSAYYPFYKKMIDDTVQAPNIAGGSLPNNPLSIRLEGSEKEFNMNPLEAIARNSLSILTASLRNDGVSKLLQDMSVSAGNIRKEVFDANGEVQEIFVKATQIEPANVTAVMETRFVFENGEKKLYQIDDPLLFEGIQGLGGVDTTGFAGMILAKPAGFLRDMVTRDPGFMAANLIRDTLSVAVTSGAPIDTDEGFTPVIDTLKNFFGDISELERFGIIGGYDFQNDEGSVRDFIRRSQRQLGLDNNNAGTVENLFYKAWDGLGAWTTQSDGATRMAVYNSVYNKLKADGATEAQAQSEAAYQALEIINFGRRGLSPIFNIITSAIPFLNARIQGLDVLGRSAFGNYSAVEKLGDQESLNDLQKRIFVTALSRGAFLMGITAIYYALVSDTDEYKGARREERDDNWIIPLPGLGRALIPIPFEVGLLFKALPERFIDEQLGRQVEKDPAKSVLRGLGTSLQVPFFQQGFGIQIAKPLAEYTSNFNSFTRSEIVPFYQLQLEEELQVRPSSNALITKIAQTFGLSPIKVESLVRGYTGTLGGYVLDLADISTRLVTGQEITPPNATSIPFLKRVLRIGDRSAGGLSQQFYELRNEVDTVVQSMNKLREDGRTDEFLAYKNTMQGVISVKGQVRALERYMKRWRERRDTILERTDINPFVKADLLKQLEAERDKRLAVVPLLREKADVPLFRI